MEPPTRGYVDVGLTNVQDSVASRVHRIPVHPLAPEPKGAIGSRLLSIRYYPHTPSFLKSDWTVCTCVGVYTYFYPRDLRACNFEMLLCCHSVIV